MLYLMDPIFVEIEIVEFHLSASLGRMTHDMFAVRKPVVGTVWNLFKVQKTINPTTNVSLSISTLNLNNSSKAFIQMNLH